MNLSTFDLLKNASSEGGFTLTDDQLRLLQQTLLEMLADLHTLAEANGIRLHLAGGALLGAVRDGNMIPWDDDIDLHIARSDYAHFLSLLREQRSDRYWLHTPETTHEYGILSVRVRLQGTDVRQREDSYSDECGVTVDLFPVENTYDDALRRLLHGLLCMGAGFLLSCRKFRRDRKNLKPLLQTSASGRQAFRIKNAVGFLVSWADVDAWTHFTVKVYSLCRNENSVLVSVPAGRNHYFREMYRRSDLLSDCKLPFANGIYYCTADPDDYLTKMYGDYRQIPPPEKREHHIYYSFEL